MSDDQWVKVAQDFLKRSFRDDPDGADELLDPKVTYRVPGTHRLAGTFEGPGAVVGHLQHLRQFTDNTIDVLKWEDWMLGVNHVAALVDVRIEHEGSLLTLRSIFLFAMTADDKIHQIEVFFSDQRAIDRFFPGELLGEEHPS